METGQKMYDLATRLYPICRSITGDGVRQTLAILKEYIPELEVHEVPSGTKVFDWTVPKEWNIRDAYIEDEAGNRIIDFKEHNLHVVGYSLPMDEWMELDALKEIIYTQPDQPDVIPYVTSYYKERSGFCMTQKQKDSLKPGKYHCVIDSTLEPGYLTYGEAVIPGESDKEIFLSTYICHPSMANNECSGPALATYLADWVRTHDHKYTYRFIFIPETIGAITYLSGHLPFMKKHVLAGFNLTCVGDNRTYSHMSSRYGDNLADITLRNVLQYHYPNYDEYDFLERGSDERQFTAPGVDLPMCTFSRSLFHKYPEYHTSADDLSIISPEGLQGSYDVLTQCFRVLEYNKKYRINVLCEPQLGPRGLYPSISQKGAALTDEVRKITDFIAYADGRNTLIDISNRIHFPAVDLIDTVEKLTAAGLLDIVE